MKLKRPEELSPQAILTVLFLLSLFSFLIVEVFPALFYRMVDTASYLVFHNIAEFFSIIVSFSIVGVGWYTFDQSRDRHALFLSSAFIGIGLLDIMHTLSYAGMPAFITPNSANKSNQLGIAVRMFTAIVFLVSAYIQSNSQNRWLTKLNLLTVIFTISGLVFVGIIFYPSYIPATFIENVGLTPFKIFLEYVTMCLFIFSLAAYWKRFSKTGNRLHIFYLAAFVFGIFSELPFIVYKSAFDTYNVIGHIYKVAAFFMIYMGIFITSVKRPYSVLQQEITERKQAEEALRKSESVLNETQRLTKVGGWEYDVDKKKITWTYEVYRIYGVSPEYYDPNNITQKIQFYRPEDRAIIERAFIQAVEEGETYDLELKFRDASGEDMWIRTIGRPERKDGSVVRVYGNIMDITSRKKAEEELKKHHEHLEELVTERTAQLNQKNEELERFNKLFVGRELKMVELKKRIAELEKEIEGMTKHGR